MKYFWMFWPFWHILKMFPSISSQCMSDNKSRSKGDVSTVLNELLSELSTKKDHLNVINTRETKCGGRRCEDSGGSEVGHVACIDEVLSHKVVCLRNSNPKNDKNKIVVPRYDRNSKVPQTRQVQEWMASTDDAYSSGHLVLFNLRLANIVMLRTPFPKHGRLTDLLIPNIPRYFYSSYY